MSCRCVWMGSRCHTAELLHPPWPPPSAPQCFWPWVCMVTGACPSSASPSTWRSPARRPRPCPWAEGWPAPCPRSRSRWSRTTTRTSTTTALGTWAARPRYKADARCLVDRTTHKAGVGGLLDAASADPRTVWCGTDLNRLTDPINATGQVEASLAPAVKLVRFMTDFALNNILNTKFIYLLVWCK